MTRRVIAAVSAVVLALIAGLLVTSYISAADRRAADGYELTDVLVVTETIPVGERAVIGDNVTVRELPQTAVAAGAVTSVAELGERVAAVDLIPGEQLLDARFVDAHLALGKAVEIPEEMAEVTVALSSDRVLGGNITAGATVGVLASYGTYPEDATTSTLLHRALVSRVQGVTTSEEPGGEPQASDGVQVSLAVLPRDVQRVVWTAEFGTLWLSLEQETTDISGTVPVTVAGLNP